MAHPDLPEAARRYPGHTEPPRQNVLRRVTEQDAYTGTDPECACRHDEGENGQSPRKPATLRLIHSRDLDTR